MHNSEQVYTVPFIATRHIPEGFCNNKQKLSDFDSKGSFVFRKDAEGNKTLQQPIAFIVVRDKRRKRFFLGKRIGGDERLHGQLSCFGGHVDKIDAKQPNLSLIESCALREINEELNLTFYKNDTLSNSLHYIGTVRDTNSDTGDHLGFVFILDVKNCSIKEADKIKGIWISYHKILTSYFYKLDNWTHFIIEHLYKTTDLKEYLHKKKS